MRLWSVIGILLGFCPSSWGGPRSVGLKHLASGHPGCFEWIRSRAAGPSEVTQQPEACRKMRSDYHRVLETIHRDRKGLLSKVGQTLRSSRSDSSPYEAILFAVLLKDQSLLPALKEREKVEKKRRLRTQFATAAIGRIERGGCPAALRGANELRELCQVRDSVLAESGRSP